MSNKPLDNRSIAPSNTHDVDVLRVRFTAAVRDVFRLIDSDRYRYIVTGAALHIALSVGDASLHKSHIVDSDRDRYVIDDDECLLHVIELLQIIAPPCTYRETHARWRRQCARTLARSLCIGSAASLAFDGYAALLVEHPLTTNIATAGAPRCQPCAVGAAKTTSSMTRSAASPSSRSMRRIEKASRRRCCRGSSTIAHGDVLGQLLSFDTDVLAAAAECTLFNQLTVKAQLCISHSPFFGITGYVQNLDTGHH